MHPTLFLAAFSVPCLLADLTAQVQVPVNPKATYLGIHNDTNALPAPAIPLSALGLGAGQWVRITTTGAFAANGSSQDTARNLVCVFSTSPSLLTATPGLLHRVPGALVAGANHVTSNTYSGNYPTDIPQDTIVGRTSHTNGIDVRVPAGASHVFCSAFGNASYTQFGNHTDPNNDFAAVFTPITPALLHGTAEHTELRTGVNGTPTAQPDVKPASPFATLSVEVAQKWGTSTGNVFVLAANAFPTAGSPPVGPLPGFHMGNDFVVVQVGVMTASPGLWSFFVPPGNAGATLIVQGFFLTSTARNGLLTSSDAHRIELQ